MAKKKYIGRVIQNFTIRKKEYKIGDTYSTYELDSFNYLIKSKRLEI